MRALQPADLAFLKEMFYASLYVPRGEVDYPKSIIARPDLAKYYQNWGQESDVGLIAEDDQQQAIGAAWSRFFTKNDPRYGFVDEATPEIGIALQSAYRNQGIGTTLITKLCEALARRDVPSVSLSVDRRNRAIHLYERLGFERYSEDGDAVTMLKKL